MMFFEHKILNLIIPNLLQIIGIAPAICTSHGHILNKKIYIEVLL